MKWIALVLAFLTAACGQAVEQGPAKPALWKIADKDTTIYLFGTVHLLPQGFDWETPTITAALNASRELIVEVVLDGPPEQAAEVMQSLATDDPRYPIAERVLPDRQDALAAAIARSGAPREAFDRLETWAVALTIASLQMNNLSAKGEYGIESLLKRRFRDADKPVTGLETLAQQLGYFDALPYPAQAKFLNTVLEENGDTATEFNAMLAMWRAGDVDKIAASFDQEMKAVPEVRDALLDQRNARWTMLIAQRMAKPGTVFLAVGAGHLAGSGSVQELLAAEGFKAERLQ